MSVNAVLWIVIAVGTIATIAFLILEERSK
jgi:hypothetical protein